MVIAGAIANVGCMVAASAGVKMAPVEFIPDFDDQDEKQSEEDRKKMEQREAALRAADQKAFLAFLSSTVNKPK